MSLRIKPLFQAVFLGYALLFGTQGLTQAQKVNPPNTTTGNVQPDINDELKTKVVKFVKDLDDVKFTNREYAHTELLRIGRRLKPEQLTYFVNELLLGSKNSLEATVRAKGILDKIGQENPTYKALILYNTLTNKLSDKSLSINAIEELLINQELEIKYTLAESLQITPLALGVLSKEKGSSEHTKVSYPIKGRVARNPNTTKEILDILSKDPDSFVRLGVAENLNTTKEILEVLSKDFDLSVKARAIQSIQARQKKP